MGQFQLVSEMTPKGDQPQAIETLTKGMLEGKKFQTLLGVTGSGKSLADDEPIWIYERQIDGRIIPLLVPIGPFIDHVMAEIGSEPVNGKETETALADAVPKQYLALSFCPKTHAVELKPILQFLRHRAPKTLYRVKTACGREVTVTGDHNFWVLRDGQLSLLQTQEIAKTDYLPIPLTIPFATGDLKWLDTVRILADEVLLVEASPLISRVVAKRGRMTIAKILGRHYQFPFQKLRKLIRGNGSDGRGVSLVVLTELADTCDLPVTPNDLKRVTIGSQFHDHTIPGKLPLSDAFLRLLGYYIAEGHGEPSHRFFTITSRSQVMIKDFSQTLSQLGLRYRRRKWDFHVASKVHTVLLTRLTGANARFKRLPYFWPTLSQRQLIQLLRAYFEGDGGVTQSNGVVAVTASRQLASELSYALLRFGIRVRVYRMRQRATNSAHHGAYYWFVTISGKENLQRFQNTIGFLSKRKRAALDRVAQKTGDAKGDVIPGVKDPLKNLRRAVGVTQETVASWSGLQRSTITLIEAGLTMPRRSTLYRIVNGLRPKARSNYQAFQNLQSLLNCRWTKIKAIKKIPYRRSYVYDLAIADNETFFGGFGGLFLHNTFTMAHVIEHVQQPTLIVSPNKTLCAQLYSEMKAFFPHNAVEYFVSYYDYYQPEAYVPSTDTYIEKDSAINEELDRLRLSATSSLMSRDDVIIVASVSCIYNLGDPSEYQNLMVQLKVGQEARRDELLSWLVGIHYSRNDVAFPRGTFRARGDVVDVFPAYRQTAYRFELSGGRIARIREIHPLTADTIAELDRLAIYPAKHFVTSKDHVTAALETIRTEMVEAVRNFQTAGKLLEAQRLESRTRYDMDMLKELGFCHGVENYSRHLSGRPPGTRPYCLLDYFPKDYLIIIDESHVTIPQIRGMYEGDCARKEVLVEYGFRLPSALDNRPQTFTEFESMIKQVIFASATPGPYELQHSGGHVVDQVIRPTGLVDPPITIKPTQGQVDDLIERVRQRAERKERVLVTTLTKRLAEDLTRYLTDAGLRVKYLHSDIDAIERVEILRDLRAGTFDCLVGINLLREGLDLPEVSLVAVLDADKEGFLRSTPSLIQVSGRAARNVNGEVVLYGDQITGSMREAMAEMQRRRLKQLDYNQRHHITPTTIVKAIREGIEAVHEAEELAIEQTGQTADQYAVWHTLSELEDEMIVCAKHLQFERAGALRDQIRSLQERYQIATTPSGRKRANR